MSDLRTTPIQSRAAKTLTAIEDAAREAIATSGTDHFTTSQVATLAGVAIGTVYTYFEDRLALLEHVYPSTIATVAEAAALGPDTVLLSKDGDVVQATSGPEDREWWALHTDGIITCTDEQLIDELAPLRVLHRPGVERTVPTPARVEATR